MSRGPEYEWRMQLRSIESRFKAIEEQISTQSRVDKEIIADLHRIAVREARQEQLSDLEERKQVLASVYESAAGYSHLIMAAGYAGALTIWQFTRDQMQSYEVLAIGLLLTVSLAIFVGYEIYRMVEASIFTNALCRLLRDHDLNEMIAEAWALKAQRYSLRAAYMWPFVVIPTLLTAAVAVAWMTKIFISGLIAAS